MNKEKIILPWRALINPRTLALVAVACVLAPELQAQDADDEYATSFINYIPEVFNTPPEKITYFKTDIYIQGIKNCSVVVDAEGDHIIDFIIPTGEARVKYGVFSSNMTKTPPREIIDATAQENPNHPWFKFVGTLIDSFPSTEDEVYVNAWEAQEAINYVTKNNINTTNLSFCSNLTS